jgi:hypothetical protein
VGRARLQRVKANSTKVTTYGKEGAMLFSLFLLAKSKSIREMKEVT